MRPAFFGLLASAHILSTPAPLLAQGEIGGSIVGLPQVATFEGLVPASQTEVTLTNQIAGVKFTGEVYVHDPATVGNSPGLPLSAATSGSAAATTFGTAMRFEQPVIQLSAIVSPSFIAVNGVSSSVRVDLIGYDIHLRERARTIIYMPASAATAEEVASFVPQKIEIRSDIPLAYASLRFDLGRIYLDDLTFTRAPLQNRPDLPVRTWQPTGSFEGLLRPWENYVALTRQIRGVTFEGEFYVVDPPIIRNSVSVPLSAATSGNAAASTRGGTMRFSRPVTEVSAFLAPSFISLNGVSSLVPVEVVGFDANSVTRARDVVWLRSAAESVDQIADVRPVQFRLRSRIPLSYVTVSFDIGRVYMDDLRFEATPELKKPARLRFPYSLGANLRFDR